MMEPILLEVKDLKTYIRTSAGLVKAVDGVSLHIKRQEIVGLVGESGCGKSMTALSIMRLLPEPYAQIAGGEVQFEGKDLVTISELEMRSIRGNRISMIFQDPLTALNPIMKIGDQIVESLTSHNAVAKEAATSRVVELLGLVGIPEGNMMARQYPFEISGGMRQRVMISMALACNPSLLIADEPTTNLDVSIQAQILDLISSIREKIGTSVLIITHNLGIVALLCERVYVMYAGKIVEEAPSDELFAKPAHPYTSLLLRSIPQVDASGKKLETIAGDVPNLIRVPNGCRFHPRCPFVKDICKEVEPEMVEAGSSHQVRCLMFDPHHKNKWGSSN